MPQLTIIANPVSGGGRAYRQIERLVREWPHSGWRVALHPTRGTDHAGMLAQRLLDAPPDLLAVCGGDGTLNEVASGIPEPPFPVALLPGGTANVMAMELGLPLNTAAALEIAMNRRVRYVDLGVMEGRQTRRFLLMAGVGFDAYIVSRVPPTRRKLGIGSYYLATIRALATHRFREFLVVMPGETVTVSSCLIANARTYGGGLVLTPDADMADGLLDVVLVQGNPLKSHIRLLFSAWMGKPGDFADVRRRRLSSLRMEGPRGIWAQADGELVGTLPLEVSLSRSSFPLVVPG